MLRDKLSPGTNPGFLKSEKNVKLHIFIYPKVYQKIFMLIILMLSLMIFIRVNNPSLNKNIGKYHLPHIWDEVLFNIPELKLKHNNP